MSGLQVAVQVPALASFSVGICIYQELQDKDFPPHLALGHGWCFIRAIEKQTMALTIVKT